MRDENAYDTSIGQKRSMLVQRYEETRVRVGLIAATIRGDLIAATIRDQRQCYVCTELYTMSCCAMPKGVYDIADRIA